MYVGRPSDDKCGLHSELIFIETRFMLILPSATFEIGLSNFVRYGDDLRRCGYRRRPLHFIQNTLCNWGP